MSEAVDEVIVRIKSSTCYYKILGVPRDIDDNGIKKAYRKLALMLHPDKCKLDGAEDAFKSVSAAYNCLSSSSSRRTYDVTGSEGNSVSSGGGHDFHGVDPNEIFEQFFRQQREMGGGLGGGQTFFFSTGGPGVRGATFSFGGPGMGGFSNMQGFHQDQQGNTDQDGFASSQAGVPWLNVLMSIIPKLGILFPLFVIIVLAMLYALLQILYRRFAYFLPILIFSPSHLKWRLVSIVLFLHFFDILPY